MTTLSKKYIIRSALGLSSRMLLVTSLVYILLSKPVLAEEAGMNIIGNQDAPTVLNVVPWKNKEFSDVPRDSENFVADTLVKKELKPVDRDELVREAKYFNILQASEDAGTE